MDENKIEITNINIKKQQDFYQNNNYNNMNNFNNFKNKNQSENSLSEGESRTITGESESDFNKKNKFNTANNFMPKINLIQQIISCLIILIKIELEMI